MPVNPSGTTPGLARATVETLPKVHMKCKRASCDSIVAVEVKQPGMMGGRHLYQCVKCKTSWGVNTGGSVNF